MKNSLVFKEITQLNMPYFNLHDITSSLGNVEYTLGVFIDLSKAFNTVDHQILIKKLQYYGIDGTALEWFKSYLSNRKQYISSQEISESCLDIVCGVPQGSILGPFIFLIYVNDLFKSVKPFNRSYVCR